ncbi:DUF6708 domain-containing protein [Pseudomonas guariconensis]|uniref:DUF6708 domain-containing protein n=1 Tax=Pseudomonas guariconensis TaxID=1288410 RepID=UPI002E1B50E8
MTAGFRYEISTPRDEPIRFNRARQKIYAYNFTYFKRWPIEVVSYDWAQVRAERWRKRARTPQGITIDKQGVMLSIIQPDTNEVVDRFQLSTPNVDDLVWKYICLYMQRGPSALPPPPPPKNHDDIPWYNISKNLAPKVQWPKDIDIESRTAP